MIRRGRVIRVGLVTVALVVALSTPQMRVILELLNGYAVQWLFQLDARYGDEVVVVSPGTGNRNSLEDMDKLLQRLVAADPKTIIVVQGQNESLPPQTPSLDRDQSVRIVFVLSADDSDAKQAPHDGVPVVLRQALGASYGYFRQIRPAISDPINTPPFETLAKRTASSTYWLTYLTTDAAPAEFDWDTIIADKVPDRFFTGKLVVVAANSADYAVPPDLRLAPLPQSVPPATFIAQALQALTDGRTLLAAPLSVTVLVLGLAALEAGIVLVLLRDRAHPIHFLAGNAAIFGITIALALFAGAMFPLAEAIAAFNAAWLIHRLFLDTNRRRRLRRQLIRLELFTSESEVVSDLRYEEWRARVSETAHSIGLSAHCFFIPSTFGKLIPVAGDRKLLDNLPQDQRRMIKQALRQRSGNSSLTPLNETGTDEAWVANASITKGPCGGWLMRCPAEFLSASSTRRAILHAAMIRLLRLYPDSDSSEVSQTMDERIARRTRQLADEAATLDALTHSAASAFAVFDLVGIFLRQNMRMRDIAIDGGMDFSAETLIGCITAVTGLTTDQTNAMLSKMLADGEPRRLAASGLKLRQKYDLRLSIDMRQFGSAAAEALGPIILAELIDVTESARLDDARRSVAQFFDQQLRNDFEAIDLVTEMLGDADLDDVMRDALLERLKMVTRRTTERMATFDVALGEMTGRWAAETMPQELRRYLDDVVDMMIKEGRKRSIEIVYERPTLLSLVIAGTDDLSTVLRALGSLALADAPSGSILTLEVSETPTAIITTFRSTGHGLPLEVVREVHEGTGGRLPDELREIADAVTAAKAWGGNIDLETGLDAGLRSILTMKRVV